MASDYSEHLDAASLRLLAETTGFASIEDANQPFRSRPHDIRLALGSPRAASLLDLTEQPNPARHRLLQLAVAVHRTAEDICKAGWVATDESVIDLNLVTFSGQSQHQQFIVGLLASYLQTPAPAGVLEDTEITEVGSLERLYSLIELCDSASETERAGVLRLLGDEALFTAGMFPAKAHRIPVNDDVLDALTSVLPKAVVGLMGELKGQLNTLLDVYLMMGPVWYRMSAQNLLFSGVRESLNGIATEFSTARRFIVLVSQGPLHHIKNDLYVLRS